jgi:hypothetical protein
VTHVTLDKYILSANAPAASRWLLSDDRGSLRPRSRRAGQIGYLATNSENDTLTRQLPRRPRCVSARHQRLAASMGSRLLFPTTENWGPIIAAPGEVGGSKVAASNALWAAFDNTERRLDGRERYVVGHHRLAQALKGERAKLFGCDASL